MKLFQTRAEKENYLTWEEYSQMIAERDRLNFLNDTAQKSINNYWAKRKVLEEAFENEEETDVDVEELREDKIRSDYDLKQYHEEEEEAQ